MKRCWASKSRASVALVLALLVVIAAIAVAACGESYEGTWVGTGDNHGKLVIKKSADGYDVTIGSAAGDSQEVTLKAVEKGGKLEIRLPGITEPITLSVDGDTLSFDAGGPNEPPTFKRQ